MSIVSYHARVDENFFGALQANPDLFWELPKKSGPAEAELLFIDKDWQALSWLLSAKGRAEQKQEAVQFARMRIASKEGKFGRFTGPSAKVQKTAGLVIETVDTKLMPDDPALTAIEGRGPRDARLAEISYYGGRVFTPVEVADLSAALDTITDLDLRAQFDPQAMEDFDVAGILWTEEEPDVLDAILISIFNNLKVFYDRAAQAGQYVLVVHW